MRRLLFTSAAVAVLAAFFASDLPDGLNYTAVKLGFAGKSADGAITVLGHLSKAISGILGIVIIYGIFLATAFIINKMSSRSQKQK